MDSNLILTVSLVLVAVAAVIYSLWQNWQECSQAAAEAGDMYQVRRVEDDSIVAQVDTDWLAEAYLDDCPDELYISYPEERYKACLAAIRKGKLAS